MSRDWIVDALGDAALFERLAIGLAASELWSVPQHFRIFVLATAGREVKDHGCAVAAVTEHVRTMLSALDRLERAGLGRLSANRRNVFVASGLGSQLVPLLFRTAADLGRDAPQPIV